MAQDRWVDDILNFWFEELEEKQWFTGSSELDELIRNRFLDLHAEKLAGLDSATVDDARTALAAIILFDQMPRNMFRGTADAFKSDAHALMIARRAVDLGFDAEFEPRQLQFLYMPFMHSEVLADQERCVDLFRTLDNEEGLKYAIEHRDIVARYGRFPHRNRVLGRESTKEESAFLEEHQGYGQ